MRVEISMYIQISQSYIKQSNAIYIGIDMGKRQGSNMPFGRQKHDIRSVQTKDICVKRQGKEYTLFDSYRHKLRKDLISDIKHTAQKEIRQLWLASPRLLRSSWKPWTPFLFSFSYHLCSFWWRLRPSVVQRLGNHPLHRDREQPNCSC